MSPRRRNSSIRTSEEKTNVRLIVMIFCRLRGRILSSDSMFNQSRSPIGPLDIISVLKKSKGSLKAGRDAGGGRTGTGNGETEKDQT
jgi:hypothetical protein